MAVEKLCQAVENGAVEEAQKIANDLLKQKLNFNDVVDRLVAVMQKVGDKFSRLEIFLPEMMQCGEAMSSTMKILTPKILESGSGKGARKVGKVILGTVKGDLHEIGKEIVKLMLEATGFEVKDLGYDVDSMTFIKEAEGMGADVIGASALMTTTMPHQKEIIDLLKDKGLRSKYKVVIGGAPTTQEWADKIGADLYCYDAGSAPKQMAKLIGK
jgi:corrinoid protein of di/trimethylamine methyltransferase